MYLYLSLAMTVCAGIGFGYGLYRFYRDESALYTDKNGVVYHCVSHVDVNEGIGAAAGCSMRPMTHRSASRSWG